MELDSQGKVRRKIANILKECQGFSAVPLIQGLINDSIPGAGIDVVLVLGRFYNLIRDCPRSYP